MINGESPEMTLELARMIMQAVMHSAWIYLLLSIILLDFISGISKAFIQGIYESKIGINGIVRHALVFLLVIFFKFFSRLFGIQSIGQGLTILFIFNYIVSVIENVEGAGVKFPEVVKKKFAQMQRNTERKLAEKLNVDVRVDKEDIESIDIQVNRKEVD